MERIDGPWLGQHLVLLNFREDAECFAIVIGDTGASTDAGARICHIHAFPPEGNGAPIWSVPCYEFYIDAEMHLAASPTPGERVAYKARLEA